MQLSCSNIPPVWSHAVGAAARRLEEAGPGALAFYEARQDFFLEIDADGGRRCDRRLARGAAVRGSFASGKAYYRADPDPEDVEDLAQVLVGGGDLAGVRGQERSTGPLVADAKEIERILEDAVGALLARCARARPRARFVGFDQTVLVGRPGRPVVRDHRSGARVRLEVSFPGQDAVAVAERVDPDPSTFADDVSAELARRIDALRGCRTIPPGDYPVVFAPGVGGVLFHELVGHALEADVVEAGASWLARVQDTVAPDAVRVVDDPRRGRASWRFDDEGEPALPVALVRGGRVAGRLEDLASASRAGCRANGHGRRASFRDDVLPRMGCTFLAPGALDAEEVSEGMEDGVYVRRLVAASTETATGFATFRVTEADRIRRGRPSDPLHPFLMRVRGADALRTIDRIGSDLAFDRCTGSCVRGGQALSTSVGGPTFRIGVVSVT